MRIPLKQAASLLNSGKVVAIPTETVYGLAASAFSSVAVEEIYHLKGRPSSNPLILHMHSYKQIQEFTKELPKDFDRLAESFWPGPMTLVLDINTGKIPGIVRAELPTAAFRVPQHLLAGQLLQLTGPLVMPSANISGTPSATTVEHVEKDFGASFPILDGGDCHVGLESTILVYLDERWTIIRQGALPAESFGRVLGYMPLFKGNEGRTAPLCPGQLFRHYAPKTQLILSRRCSEAEREIILGFADRSYPSSNRLISLGRLSDPDSIAENLYKTLRLLDEQEIKKAFVDIDFSSEGILSTVLERLTKAAQSLPELL